MMKRIFGTNFNLSPIAFVFMGLLLNNPLEAEIMVSNFSSPRGTSFPVLSSAQQLAQAFITGSLPSRLYEVRVNIPGYSFTKGPFEFSIYNDLQGLPGDMVPGGKLTESSRNLYFSSEGIELKANSCYWVVASCHAPSEGGWKITNWRQPYIVTSDFGWNILLGWASSYGGYWHLGSIKSSLFLEISGEIITSYKVPLDIKPGSCPNPLNVKSKGVLPIAVLGSDVFDVNDIDIASLEILGVKPIRSSLEDVATPVSIDTLSEDCLCTTDGPDGYMDLMLKFNTQEIVEAIGEMEDGDYVILTLTGFLMDGTLIEGTDCVSILKNGNWETMDRKLGTGNY